MSPETPRSAASRTATDHRAPTISGVRRYFERSHLHLSNGFATRVRATAVGEIAGALPEGAGIVDLGCGDATISAQFLGGTNRLTLVDLADAMLAASRRNVPESARQRVSYIRDDFLLRDFDRRFDLVLCVGVLAHVESVERAIRKVATLCAAGGRCVLEYTDCSSALGRFQHAYTRAHRRVWSTPGYVTNRIAEGRIAELTAEAGLRKVDQIRYSLLLPGMRHLPDSWLAGYEEATLRNNFLARLGSEVIAVFEPA
jgi:SAM-dependent methyltransferase